MSEASRCAKNLVENKSQMLPSSHGNKRRKPERGASLQMCKEIIEKWRVLVPVGAGMVLFSFFVV